MSRKKGSYFEIVAQNFLTKKGYKILGCNVTYSFAELDIVAQKNDLLVFVEVKARKNKNFGEPFEAVGKNKQQKIINAAKAYLQNFKHKTPQCRFDILSIVGNENNFFIDHLEDAFWEEV